MAEVGTYYVTIMPEMSKFTGSIKGALGAAGKDGGNDYQKSFMATLKGSAIGVALGGLAQKAGSAIMSGLQTGIGRLDTIENFPKVMESLGFESKEAEKSIQLIMKRLDGLPTATQDVVALTQSIADSTGSLDLATKASLGFNDMMLASGASTAEVSQAQGVLNRVLGKGNATTAQWQSLQSVMPAQLAAVARELMGEGASVEGLRESLNDGTIGWDEFLQAVVKLDTEGSGAMASFEEQARANSKGIGTALANVPNRIGAGWADVLKAIGREDISSTIDTMSYGVRDAMSRVAEGIGYVKDRIGETDIAKNLSELGAAIGEIFASLTEGGPEMLKGLTDTLIDLVDNALKWLVDNKDAVKAAIGGIAGIIAGMLGWDIGVKLAGLPALITGVWTALSANPFAAIAILVSGLVMALYTFFTQTETGKKIWENFCKALSNLWAGLKKDFETMIGTIKQNLEANKLQWELFKTKVGETVEGIKTKVTQIVSGTIAKVTADWNEAKTSVLQTFESIKTGIVEKIEWVRTRLGEIVEKIKGLFDFEWSLPAPKMPHIEWHWEDVGGVLSLPVFDGVNWYGKGGVFDTATIIGIGEAGKEAALPLNEATYREIARGIWDEMGGGGGVSVLVTGNTFSVRSDEDIDRIADAIARRTARQRAGMA